MDLNNITSQQKLRPSFEDATTTKTQLIHKNNLIFTKGVTCQRSSDQEQSFGNLANYFARKK